MKKAILVEQSLVTYYERSGFVAHPFDADTLMAIKVLPWAGAGKIHERYPV
jgi:hypothetical protein